MGDEIPPPSPPPPTVSEGGTLRDFGNMLMYHKGKRRKKSQKQFSPWEKVK